MDNTAPAIVHLRRSRNFEATVSAALHYGVFERFLTVLPELLLLWLPLRPGTVA